MVISKSYCPFCSGGYYELRVQYTETIPIPEATEEQKQVIGDLAEKAQEIAEARYVIQEQVRKRIQDLTPEGWDGKLKHQVERMVGFGF